MSKAFKEAPTPPGYDPQLYRLRHSTAHVMAQAVRERFQAEGPVHFAAGPPTDDGFFYDFSLPRSATEEDLAWIEERMREIVRGGHAFEVREVNPDEARTLFADQPFKLELIEGLSQGTLDEDGNPIAQDDAPPITVYQHDTFADLCRGPHIANTSEIVPEAIKLLTTAGAYWRGDENRDMLQRIYGTVWKSKEDLDQYLWRRAEAEKRDHRKLGKELELFHMEPSAPGMPYWLPRGFKLLLGLLDFWREEHDARGYQEISTPLINDKRLWETSGHWEHYRSDMFLVPIDENRTFGVKPMNCPNAMVVFNLKKRSYRELPLRLSDCDMLHRNERSGTLHGLLRVQKFQQDDAHIFCTEDMIESEYAGILDICARFYDIFDLKYTLRLGTRPKDAFIGDVETWDRAEAALRRILDTHSGEGGYEVRDGDGAFYGPKVDIVMEDALGRTWQMGTIQLDFQLPRRFNCKYVDRDGQEKTPVVVHRVIYGSLERFIGVLIEHTAGAFPVWLSPVQVAVLPVTDKQNDYAHQVAARLREQRVRVEVDDSNERMGHKIRAAQLQKTPYMLVVGKREVAAETVSVRLRTEEDLGAMSVDDFLTRARQVIADKRGL
ncbi:threonine--tRNA ligase [Haliangium sp.]|uniref:threonine--tRNA ligase n=1 Tax=Haliangium sp. TaxID=2663208 RepID=UPI003D0E742B